MIVVSITCASVAAACILLFLQFPRQLLIFGDVIATRCPSTTGIWIVAVQVSALFGSGRLCCRVVVPRWSAWRRCACGTENGLGWLFPLRYARVCVDIEPLAVLCVPDCFPALLLR